MSNCISNEHYGFIPRRALRDLLRPFSFVLFITAGLGISDGQINPEDGNKLMKEIQGNQAHVAEQRHEYGQLLRISYFRTSIDNKLISDNMDSCDSLLFTAMSLLTTLNFQAAEHNMVSCHFYMYATDVMLKEDLATSSARFQQIKPDYFAAPAEVLPTASGIETRTIISSQLDITQRLVNLIWPGVLNRSVFYATSKPECNKERDNFYNQYRPGENNQYRAEEIVTLFANNRKQLHLLQYDSAHEAVWKIYVAAQRVATACGYR